MAITLQTGIREYTGDLSQYTGMLGGLTPDIHTLRSFSPLTSNRVIVFMHRGPYFLMHYLGGKNAYSSKSPFAQFKKIIEYYNTGIEVSAGDQSLNIASLQGGFAGRSIPIPTTQNVGGTQSLTITVPELSGRIMTNVNNMWINGISDEITSLTTYHGLVAGSVDENGVSRRLFTPLANTDQSDIVLEPSPAWEVAEFVVVALDRSGARPEAAIMGLGALPTTKIGNEIFNSNPSNQSNIISLRLTFQCQFIQSAYVNDLAARYVSQFAVFGNSLNINPGAGDAFFKDSASTMIDSPMFNNGKRPTLDAVQSGLGNAPVFKAGSSRIERGPIDERTITPADHSRIYNDNTATTDITNPYSLT